VGLTLVIALVLGTAKSEPTARSSAASGSSLVPSAPAAAASATIAPTATLAASITCRADPAPLPSYLAGDPCPSAILAVELAVAPVRLPIERLVIEPGPLFCNVIWEGLGSPPICYGPFFRPGQFMHAYVQFAGSAKIAVVMLGLDLPIDEAPAATRPPWSATLVTVEVPPASWVMP
jgi:hypothetical protein